MYNRGRINRYKRIITIKRIYPKALAKIVHQPEMENRSRKRMKRIKTLIISERNNILTNNFPYFSFCVSSPVDTSYNILQYFHFFMTASYFTFHYFHSLKYDIKRIALTMHHNFAQIAAKI